MINLEQEFERLMVELYQSIQQKQTAGQFSMKEANNLAMLVKQRTGYNSLGHKEVQDKRANKAKSPFTRALQDLEEKYYNEQNDPWLDKKSDEGSDEGWSSSDCLW